MQYLTNSSRDVTNKVLQVIEKLVAIWNEKNADGLGTLFTEDTEFVDVVGQIAIGKNQVIEQHRFPFAVTNKIAVFSIYNIYIRNISDTIVLATVYWLNQKGTTPKGDILPDRHGAMQIILVQVGGELKIKLVHNLDFSQAYSGHWDTSLRFFESKK